MKITRCVLPVTLLLFIVGITAFASDTEESINQEKKIGLSGMTAFELGQFVRGHHKQKEFEYRPWILRLYGQLKIDANMGERLRIILNPEVKLWNDSYPRVDFPDRSSKPFRLRTTVSFVNGQGIFTAVDIENIFKLNIAAGVIQYKYNPDAYNLGEYLFRSGTHPAYIITSFDYAFATLPGLQISSIFLGRRLTFDAFLTFETEIQPLFDGSVSLLAGYKQPGLFDENTNLVNVGVGVSFDRCIPVSGEIITTPNVDNARNKYLTKDGEEKYYSFGGAKLMGRLSLDPKGFLPETFTSRFSSEDWKLFCEVAVLGVKNCTKYCIDSIYPIVTPDTTIYDTTYQVDTADNYYKNRKERIPIMFGFNVPFPLIGRFRLWDICSFQMEYYGWPYTNSLYNQGFNYENPIPNPVQSYPKRAYEMDNWKFSLFIKKTFLNSFSLIGQVARDHTHHDIYYESERDEEEVFTKTDEIEKFEDVFNPKKWGEYGWWLKLQYNF